MTTPFGSTDTIAAICTAPGRGAVGIIRVSGPAVPSVAAALLGALPAPRAARLMSFHDGDGTSLDQGVVLFFPAPASFTGEHVLELQGHGGALVLDLVLRRVLELGCRAARAGEFSERAFLNGKMDVAQAEAVADLIDAGTQAAARAALRSLQGAFSERVHEIQARLTGLRTYVEAAIDFPDEELDFLSDAALDGRMAAVSASFDALLAAVRQGALLRDGMTLVIAGKPNAGKSTLLNRLAGAEVAIVTDQPGTTRDPLRQSIHLDGMPLHLVDTAGLRVATDVVEVEGIRRAYTAMGSADRVLYLMDAITAPVLAERPAELAALPVDIPVSYVVNKVDLLGDSRLPGDESAHPAGDGSAARPLRLSALTGAGFDELCAHLKHVAGFEESAGGALSARRRHLDALQRAQALVTCAIQTLRTQRAYELFAEDLRLAQQVLGEITGEFTSEDLLGEIFGSFCIGK